MKNFLPRTLQSWLVCLLLLALTALIMRVFVSAGRIEKEIGQTTSAAQTLVLEAQGFIAGQRGLAEENKKSLEAAYQVGAVFNGTGRLINTQMLPRLMKTADASTVLLSTLNENAVTLNRTIANLDDRVSGDKGVLVAAIALLKGLDSTAERLGVTAATLDRMLTEIGSRANLSMDEIYLLVSNPQLHQMIQNATITSGNVAKTSEKVDATMESVRVAAEKMPNIAASVDKLAKTTSKYQKLIILTGILTSLARVLVP